jgi:hypothetical protein
MDRSGSGTAASAHLVAVVALLGLLSLGAAVAGCGGDERDAVRERVEHYIESEREVMERTAPQLERANQAYIAYSKGELEAESASGQVAEAERAIRAARDGVLVLDPPAEARPLHEDLLRYLDLNVGLARETKRLVTYVPAAASALAPLARVNRRLELRLALSEDSGEQARELDRFAESVGAIRADLRALNPPGVLRPTHGDQLRRLAVTRRLAGRLRDALRAQDAVQVSRLLKRFRGDASEPDARRLLANQALARYSERLRELTDAGAAVQREQLRLARSLP